MYEFVEVKKRDYTQWVSRMRVMSACDALPYDYRCLPIYNDLYVGEKYRRYADGRAGFRLVAFFQTDVHTDKTTYKLNRDWLHEDWTEYLLAEYEKAGLL